MKNGLHKTTDTSTSSKRKHDSERANRTPHVQRSVKPQPDAGLIVQRITQDPSDFSPSNILQLQRTAGNRAVNQLLARQGIQAKLTVGAANGPYEREADRVATQVLSTSNTPTVSRQEDEQAAQRKVIVPTITPLVQRSSQPAHGMDTGTAGSFDAGADVERQLSTNRGSGSPLPARIRSELEPRFGNSFSAVRVHTGTQSDQLNRKLGAQAFTHGADIYMGAGKYNPDAGSGKHLLAHELTHVVQQGGAQTGVMQRAIGCKSIDRTTDGSAIQRWFWNKSPKASATRETASPEQSGTESTGDLTAEQIKAIKASVAELPPESVLEARVKAREKVATDARKQAEEEGLPVAKGKPNLVLQPQLLP